MTSALEVRNITKRFPGVIANDQISFTLEPGEIHAFLGENGAGKSTLMNILYGLYAPDEGEIRISGQRVEMRSPNDAIQCGLGMVHQHFMLVPTLTVAENIMLGTEITRGPLLDQRRANRQIDELSDCYGLTVPPEALVQDLPVGVQQRVEIIKALYRGADILILDEPTAVLTPQETQELFAIMRTLVEQGKSIIFISHKLKEVLAIADRITVLRRGRVVGTTTPTQASEASLAAMMVGREVALTVTKQPTQAGPVVLDVQDVVVYNDQHTIAVNRLSLAVHAGEVLGIAGVQGNGQTELIETLTGLRPSHSGHIHLNGRNMTGASPRTILDAGVAHIPEDRHRHGLVLSYPISDNLVLSTYGKAPFSHGIVIDDQAIESNARELIATFDVRTPSPSTTVGALSGGNQQKVVIAREFSRQIRLLIAAQPTRGLDVGSIEFIHGQIIQQRDSGVAVLLISAELDEILALSDRIAVMFRGNIIAVMPASQATREGLGLLMAGIVEI